MDGLQLSRAVGDPGDAAMKGLSVRSRAGLPTGPWRGQLVLSFRRTAWFSDGTDSLVGLVASGLSPSPCGLELAGGLPPLRPGTWLESVGRRWLLGGFGQLEDAESVPDVTASLGEAGQVPASTADWQRLWRAWFALQLPKTAEGQWLSTLTQGPQHWESLIGRGSGSTPLGDDYLAGWFAARRRRGLWPQHELHGLRRILSRTTRLSRHFLFHLTEGRVDASLRDFFSGNVLPDPDSPAAAALAAHGDLSGRATLVGLFAGMTSGE